MYLGFIVSNLSIRNVDIMIIPMCTVRGKTNYNK